MKIEQFLERNSSAKVSFDETMSVISEHYQYHPTVFSNGIDSDRLINNAGTNEGSCKIFAFAKLHGLDKEQTLNLFGDFYHLEVLEHAGGTGHQNIRNFMKYGWKGIYFEATALSSK